MSMSVGGSGDGEDRGIMSEINTTPLVDIMLVLLIIFLITIPVITKNVQVSVPKAVNIPTQTKPENITISVSADGEVYWGQWVKVPVVLGVPPTWDGTDDSYPVAQVEVFAVDRPTEFCGGVLGIGFAIGGLAD